MSFDYSVSARRPHTVPCYKDLFETVIKSVGVSSTCAMIKDALEKVKRGEMSREDFETYKRQQKFCFQPFFFRLISRMVAAITVQQSQVACQSSTSTTSLHPKCISMSM